MKILKIALGVVAALVVCFLALGLLNPTVNYTTTVEADKPLTEAWAVFSDEEKLPLWIEGYKGMTVLEGQKDEVGSKYLLDMEMDGEPYQMTETLTAIEKEKLYAMTFNGEGFEQDVRVEFAPVDENTTSITATGEMRGEGIMMQSIFATMNLFGAFEKTATDMYTRLQGLIEENTTDYRPAPAADATLPEVEAVQEEQVQ